MAAIYRLAAVSKGVFVNPALTEPFGLTLLEAAASGVPLVATENGGPVDIIENCQNGLLIDPLNEQAIVDALLKLLENPEFWQTSSENGIKNVAQFYSWDAHAKSYLHKIQSLVLSQKPFPNALRKEILPSKIGSYRERAIFTALDNTLLGDDEALHQFVK